MDIIDFLDTPNGDQEEVKLTDAQWAEVTKEWNKRPDNPPSISELTKLVFKKDGLDGRSKEGRAIKKRLADASLKAPTTSYKDYEKGLLELSEEQKTYVQNNYKSMSPVEMARILFDNKNLGNLHQETRTISELIKTELDAAKSFFDVDDVPTESYFSPKSVEGAVKKINKYRFEPMDKENLNGKQKKDLSSLLNYLNTYRFVRQINTYSKTSDRELFESTFLRYTYDKFDLTEEEVDQYILLATEVVIAATIQSRLDLLNNKLDDASKEDDKSISMSWVEAIGKTQSEYNACITRQRQLLDSLKVKRSEKEGKNKDGAASILNLVELAKDEESRKKLVKLALKRQDKLKESISEFMSMDELKCRIVGITMDEVLNG